MSPARVKSIHRYPVKSMGGESLERVTLTARGLVGDRAWAVRDEVRGGIRGAKQLPALMQCSARYTADPPAAGSGPAEITLPDGTRVQSDAPEAALRISEAIAHRVTLWPLQPADDLEHYKRGAPSHPDMETELRAIFGRTPEEPLPDLGLFPPDVLAYESPPGTYFDAFPLLLLSEASLHSMQRAVAAAGEETTRAGAASRGTPAASVFDPRRFRANLLLEPEGDADPFPELAWRGRKLRIGGAVLRATIECPRCVMTTHAQGDLPKDPQIMRALVREAGGNLGVYATVEEPGEVAVGDRVEAL